MRLFKKRLKAKCQQCGKRREGREFLIFPSFPDGTKRVFLCFRCQEKNLKDFIKIHKRERKENPYY